MLCANSTFTEPFICTMHPSKRLMCISLFSAQQAYMVYLLVVKGTETQRGVTHCLGSYSYPVTEPGFKARSLP